MKYWLLAFALLTACTPKPATVQEEEYEPLKLASVNIIDQNGMTESVSGGERLKKYGEVDFLSNQPYQKVMRVFARDSKGDINAYLTSYHPNGQIKQYLEVVNGRAFGCYKEWFPNGALKVSATVIGGEADLTSQAEKTWLFEGETQAFDEMGRKIASINYSKGFQEGAATYYHEDGSIWKKINYSQSKVEGPSVIYKPNGEILSQANYSNGEMNGPSKRFWTPCQIASDEIWNHGKLETGSYYDLDGTPISEISCGTGKRTIFGKETVALIVEYKNGAPDGKVEAYSAQGYLANTYTIKNEQKHGEELQFYQGAKLIPKVSINWYQGKIQGLVKTYYPDGSIESQKEMANNKKNGLFSAWYRDGGVMMMEEYDQGKLVRGEYYAQGSKLPLSTIQNGKGIATIHDAEGHFVRKINYLNGKPND